uniref:DNA/RNA helicase protein n=1 Tax=Kalanchoe fedtschenkoi TaxID=63787 RepID=A0A7N0TAB6_KALFE
MLPTAHRSLFASIKIPIQNSISNVHLCPLAPPPLQVPLHMRTLKIKSFTLRRLHPTMPSSSTQLSFPDPPSEPDACLLGFLVANIVGLQYYSSKIKGREMVALVREPQNEYDSNAIAVTDIRMAKVGHIERSVAAVLSPLLDRNLILVQGIVPNFGSKRPRYKVPVQVHVFSRVETFEVVNEEIAARGLQLILHGDVRFGMSEAVAVKENCEENGAKDVDEIFKLADQDACKKDELEVMEPPKELIKSELFQHQKEGLGWLVGRENSEALPPFWEEADGSYRNQLTGGKTNVRPEPLRGGILADDMGMGKTLTLLSLVAFDKCFINDGDDKVAQDEVVMNVNGRKGKRSRSSQQTSNSRKKGKRRISVGHILENEVSSKEEKNSIALACKTTLVVCPPSVLSTWVTQLEEHTVMGTLKMYMYYGERTSEVEELTRYDIVLTTYSTLSAEERLKDSPLKCLEWRRIILDEAHVIKNPKSNISRAVTSLKAKRRWVVTGTPIQNGTCDLFSLMAFLHFEPFATKSYWQDLVNRPLSQGSKEGLMRLQVLMDIISLRRTKDTALMSLPAKSVETCFVELSSEERELYDHIEGEAKNLFKTYINNGNVVGQYATMLTIILRLRQICVCMELCPPDMRSIVSDGVKDVSDNPELLQKLLALLQDGEDFDCPICISPPDAVIITRCAHIFCRACILKVLKRDKPSCPLCRRSLSEADLFSAPQDTLNSENDIPSTNQALSSKVSTLIKLLTAAKDENPSGKSVVFSQFQKLLVMLEEPLKQAGFSTLRLDGSMNGNKRAQVIKEFGKSDGPTILLASLKASGTGINLTAASTVYLLEPWWNPAVEKQAMDRVHRIGQKHDVKIVRLIAQHSIEERVLELQEKKKMFAREAFRKRGSKDKREVNIDDLRTLMSL